MTAQCKGARLNLLGWIVVTFAWLLPSIAGATTIHVVLRYDDYSSFQSDPRVIAFERALFDGVRSIGGNLFVGVIPFPAVPHPQAEPPPGSLPLALLDDKRQLLRHFSEAGTVTVALHGFNHGKNHRVPGTSSEFAGLPEAQQVLLLKLARQALREATGLDARIFVPPFNQYDDATLRALATSGFELLSAGSDGVSDEQLALQYLPGTVHPQGLRRAVTAALAAGRDGAIVIATMHPYDFVDAGNPMPEFRTGGHQVRLAPWLEELREIAAMDGVRLVSIQQLRDGHEDMSSARLRANQSIRFGLVAKHRLLPQALGLYAIEGVHDTTNAARKLYFQQLVALAVIMVVALLASWLATRAVMRRLRVAGKDLRLVAVGVGMLGIAGAALRGYSVGFYFATAMILVICTGVMLGAIGMARRN